MDKIEKIRQEIERLKSTNPSEYNYQNEEGYIWALDDLLSFIDNLEEEPASKGYDEAYLNEKIAKASKTWEGVDVDKYMDEIRGREPDKSLEEAAEDFRETKIANGHFFQIKETKPLCYLDDLIPAFIAGAKWQAGQLLKGSPLPEDTVIFNKGVAEGKRLMLEEAVEGYVTYNYTARIEGLPYATVIANEKPLDLYESRGFKLGDRVRIIVCKNED